MKELLSRDEELIEIYQREELPKYPKPSVATDIVAIRPALIESEDGDWRKNPTFALELLLIKRGQWPYEGCWALPGGFVKKDQNVFDCARDELEQETRLKTKSLIPIGVFSDKGRDMRSWVISNAFVSVHKRGEGDDVSGGDDASFAKWIRIDTPVIFGGTFRIPFMEGDKELFTVEGTYCETEFDGGYVLTVNDTPLAFDHAKIIAQAFIRMTSFDKKKIALFFLPEKFTIAEFVGVYNYLDPKNRIEGDSVPNFRRQLTGTSSPFLVECEGTELGNRGHRAAKLYRRYKK